MVCKPLAEVKLTKLWLKPLPKDQLRKALGKAALARLCLKPLPKGRLC